MLKESACVASVYVGLGRKETRNGILPARNIENPVPRLSFLPNSKETLATQAMKEFARFTLTFVFTALEINGYGYCKLGKIERKFLSYAQCENLL